MIMYQDSARKTHFPGSLMGFCQSTSAGNINAGTHTISVEVAQVYGKTNLYTGYDSTTTLEVRELCTPFWYVHTWYPIF